MWVQLQKGALLNLDRVAHICSRFDSYEVFFSEVEGDYMVCTEDDYDVIRKSLLLNAKLTVVGAPQVPPSPPYEFTCKHCGEHEYFFESGHGEQKFCCKCSREKVALV